MARAPPEPGRIWTIDPDAKRTEIAHFTQADLDDVAGRVRDAEGSDDPVILVVAEGGAAVVVNARSNRSEAEEVARAI